MFRRILPSAVLLLLLLQQPLSAYCNCPMCQYIRANGLAAWNALMSGRQAIPQITAIVSTPQPAVEAMVRELQLTPNDLLYDLGCGDGRILIEAVRHSGCRAVGIEIDPSVAERARCNVRRAEYCQKIRPRRIRIVTGDARRYKLDQATAVTMYLFPDLMAVLTPKLRPDVRVASYAHEVSGHHNRIIQVPDCQAVYVVDLRPLSYMMGPDR